MAREPIPVQQRASWQQVLACQTAIAAAGGLTITLSGCTRTPGKPACPDVEVRPATRATIPSAEPIPLPGTPAPIELRPATRPADSLE